MGLFCHRSSISEDQLLAEMIALRAAVGELVDRVASLEKENTMLSENQEIQLKLINKLRAETRKAPQPMQKDQKGCYPVPRRTAKVC
jgi:predicted nuclease with TOPRIM domain